MSRKGVVLSWRAGKAQVLDTEGRFVSVFCPRQVEVGQEISLPRVQAGWMRYVAAACLIVTLCGGLWFDSYALAYVALDINPSIELGVNWRDKVVEVKALNAEANPIVSAHNPRGLPVAEAVTTIVRESLKSLPTDLEPIAVVSVSGRAKADSIRGVVQEAVEKELSKETKPPQVVGVVVPPVIRNEAKEAGVSPGQYALALKATEKGSPVTAAEIINKGLEKAMTNAGVDLKTVSKDAEEEKNFGQVKKEIREQVKGNAPANPKPNPNAKPNDNPKGNPNDNPKGNPNDNPKGNPNDNPKGNPNDNPKGNPNDNPKGNPNDNPKGNPNDNPKGNPNDNPKGNPNDNPRGNPQANPKANPKGPQKK